MADPFRIADLEIFAVGEEQCLVRPKSGGAPHLLPEADARLLAFCNEYRPIDEHARAWAMRQDLRKVEQVGQHGPRWLARVLDAGVKAAEPSAKVVAETQRKLVQLAERGLLRPRSTFVSDLLRHGGDEPAAPIAALGFTTRRRTAELRRALDSYAANFRLHGRTPEIVIVDDSRDTADEAATEKMLRDFQSETDLEVRFIGLAEREAYAAALAREGSVHPDIARFALLGDADCPVTTGSARNALLLDCVSTRYVLADDDGVCRMAHTPDAQEGLEILSQNDPTQFWFFESREALHEKVAFTDEPDLFGLHETLLGRPLGRMAEETGLEVGGASPDLEGRLRRLGGSVRTSMAGVVGDSGVASTAYLWVDPRSLPRLTSSEAFYHAAVANRQMLRAPQRAALSEGFLTMAGNLGIDNTALFPPFPPVQRNSDGIVGRLLQSCFPASCRGYLNWAVLHDPVGARSQSLDVWFEEARSIRFADILSVFLRDAAEELVDDPALALQAVGGRLHRLGGQRHEAFREELRKRIVGREGSRLAQLRRAGKDGVPEFYLALQRRYIGVIEDAVTREDMLAPRDLPGQSLSLAQSLVGRIGALLTVWPRLWHAAQWMRANGRRLSRPVA